MVFGLVFRSVKAVQSYIGSDYEEEGIDINIYKISK